MNKTVILHVRNLKDHLTNEQIADNIRGLLHPALLVDIRVVDESSVADKTAWLKGSSDVECSYNVIAEWLSSGIMQTVAKPGDAVLAELQKLIYAALTAARQAAAQDAYKQAAVLLEAAAEAINQEWYGEDWRGRSFLETPKGKVEAEGYYNSAAKIRALAAAGKDGKQ